LKIKYQIHCVFEKIGSIYILVKINCILIINMKTCKQCDTICKIKESKSKVHFGNLFYYCPDHCVGWIGWVQPDDYVVEQLQFTLPERIMDRTMLVSPRKLYPTENTSHVLQGTSAACDTFEVIESKAVVSQTDPVRDFEGNVVNCIKCCGGPVEIKVCDSRDNKGKEFYSCASGCQGWIGWVEDLQPQKVSPQPLVPLALVRKKSELSKRCIACGGGCVEALKGRGKPYWNCPNKCQTWNGWIVERLL